MIHYKTLFFSVLLFSQPVLAIDIYKCVDHEGVTHFSAEPISDCENQQEIIILDEIPSAHDNDEYSILNQLERMEKRKAKEQQRQRARLEEELLRAQIRATRRQAVNDQKDKKDQPDRPVTYVPIYVAPGHSHRTGRKHSRTHIDDKPQASLPHARHKQERGVTIQVDIK